MEGVGRGHWTHLGGFKNLTHWAPGGAHELAFLSQAPGDSVVGAIRPAGAEPQFPHFPALGLWASYITYLSLFLPLKKTGITTPHPTFNLMAVVKIKR